MKNHSAILILLLLGLSCTDDKPHIGSDFRNEKTVFQTSSLWMPEIDVRSDVAIVYGVHGNPSDGEKQITFEERVESWREQGYKTHFMTGIAWGSYQDYFLGGWDGKNHLGEGQVERNGDTIWHGHNVPYIVPTPDFIAYIKKTVIERVIDAGISSIYFEEPEFWSRAGYSSVFKKEWKNYYGFDWRPQHESPENTYLSNKLKYSLYYNTLKEVSSYAKSYGKSKGLDVKVYIPTHSLVNYSSWQIVSPEASLASLSGIDGYIAQVWTGTSREPTYYNGTKKERTFENAFLEYGSMVSMTAPTKSKLFFLTDPIEDRNKTWEDYKKNYEATFIAQLLYPSVADYEVMPWPERIYTRPYQIANTDKHILIPRSYSTQMQIMINALNDMPISNNKVSGCNGIGVLMGNSLMFQRFPTHNGFNDPQFSNFYGQTLPLVKRGIPVQTVHMENLAYEATLKDIQVLVMSYSNMKPSSAKIHKELTNWVSEGGVLIYVGRDNDPYQSIQEWWNTEGNNFKSPSEHLYQLMDISPIDKEGEFTVGKGKVYLRNINPKEFVMVENGDKEYIETIKSAFKNVDSTMNLKFKNNFYLQRGAYKIISVMNESTDTKNYEVEGPVIDLFDSGLPILTKKIIPPGSQAFLYDINAVEDKTKPQVLATASRIYNETRTDSSYAFIAKSPKNTTNVMRILLPQKAKEIKISDANGRIIPNFKKTWDLSSKTLRLEFENNNEGIQIELNW
ncbi:hypothetical protein HZY62_21595 [Maribacter polysiphoniae]|uniref:Beta-galactosidase-like protein n=1 Tax=Maribacter polysiphoniae TaxID=429344 RepID=A0A316DIM1_9FLAO|nr:hypothetical protein [Maribacter polysiphoniae]MBD1263195.1 hypothetical protein [Maribacter polysiphoniae]PWK18107.1 hypothetical protein LX92_04401 [Maribacter polysiphoniae]